MSDSISLRAALAVLALTVATLALRLWGIDHCLPHWKEADAHMALHAERLREGLDAPDPKNNDNQYPIALPGLLALLPSTEAPPAERRTLDDHLQAAARIYVEMRVEIAFFSALLVPLTYAFARRFLTRGWSFFAAALIAASLLLEFFGQQARPHAAAVSFFLLAVLASMRLARAPTWKSYVLASAATALAIGVLHSGLATLIPLLVAAWIAPVFVVHEPARRLIARFAFAPLLALAVAATAIVVFYPYLRREGSGTQFDHPMIEGGQLVWGDHHIAFSDFLGLGFVTVARTLWSYEPLLLALLVLALAAWLVRKLPIYRPLGRWSDFWVAASFAVPYLIAIGLFERTFERFAIPLLPFLATFAAWGLAFWSARLGATGKRVLAGTAALSLALPSFACARLAWLRASDDTLERSADWLVARPDALATPIYVAPFFDLPLARSRESLQPSDKRPPAFFSRWSIYQKRVGPDVVPAPRFDLRYLTPRPDLGFDMARIKNDSLAYVRALGPGYYVVDLSRQPFSDVLEHLRDALAQCGELVHREAPEQDGTFGLAFEDEVLPDWPDVFPRALRARAVGPVVEVWRVR